MITLRDHFWWPLPQGAVPSEMNRSKSRAKVAVENPHQMLYVYAILSHLNSSVAAGKTSPQEHSRPEERGEMNGHCGRVALCEDYLEYEDAKRLYAVDIPQDEQQARKYCGILAFCTILSEKHVWWP